MPMKKLWRGFPREADADRSRQAYRWGFVLRHHNRE
jgi:hypothetical protein